VGIEQEELAVFQIEESMNGVRSEVFAIATGCQNRER
jgi:hypothetical protein